MPHHVKGRITTSYFPKMGRFITFTAAAGISVIGGVSLWAQSETPKSFDAASLKLNDSGRTGFKLGPPAHGALDGTNATVKMLIAFANRTQESKVVGGPSWVNSDRYDMAAKGPETATNPEVWEMLQTLLSQRFKLVVHRDTRELPVYALVVGKKGIKLTPAEEGACAAAIKASQPCGSAGIVQNGVIATNVSMTNIAALLARQLDRPVVDKTGLKGKYDCQLYWVPDGYKEPDAAAMDANPREPRRILTDGPSIFAAVQEIAGLKLEAEKGPVEVVVIDKIEKPSAN